MIGDSLLGVPSIQFSQPSVESLCIRGSLFEANGIDVVTVVIADVRSLTTIHPATIYPATIYPATIHPVTIR